MLVMLFIFDQRAALTRRSNVHPGINKFLWILNFALWLNTSKTNDIKLKDWITVFQIGICVTVFIKTDTELKPVSVLQNCSEVLK